MTSDVFKGANGGFARNMSAPPRSTVSFRPYGAGPLPASGGESASGLQRIARASVLGLIDAHNPVRGRRIMPLGERVSHLAHKRDPAVAGVRARYHAEIFRGMVGVAASLLGKKLPLPELLSEERLSDLMSDIAQQLSPPALPAMGIVEQPGSFSVLECPTGVDPLHAGLWLLTHLNGRTFVRDMQAIPVPSPFASSVYELYAP